MASGSVPRGIKALYAVGASSVALGNFPRVAFHLPSRRSLDGTGRLRWEVTGGEFPLFLHQKPMRLLSCHNNLKPSSVVLGNYPRVVYHLP
jgi:hypothetical protein